MFADTLALSPDVATAVATNTVSHVARFRDDGRSQYSVASLTPPTEKTLEIGHTVDKNAVQRSVIKLTHTLADSNGVVAFGGVAVTVNRPNNSAFTDAVLIAIFNELANLLSTGSNGNLTKLLNKEL